MIRQDVPEEFFEQLKETLRDYEWEIDSLGGIRGRRSVSYPLHPDMEFGPAYCPIAAICGTTAANTKPYLYGSYIGLTEPAITYIVNASDVPASEYEGQDVDVVKDIRELRDRILATVGLEESMQGVI